MEWLGEEWMSGEYMTLIGRQTWFRIYKIDAVILTDAKVDVSE